MTIQVVFLMLFLDLGLNRLPNPLVSMWKITHENQLKKDAHTTYLEKQYPLAGAYLGALRDSLKLTDDKITLNLGQALYMSGNIQSAVKEYEWAYMQGNPEVRSRAANHLGVLSYKADQDKSKALEYFKDALRANPHNEEARYNYEFLKKLTEAKQDPKMQNKKDPQQDQQKDKQDQQNQQNQQDQQDKNKNNNPQDKNQADKGNNGKADKNQRKDSKDPGKEPGKDPGKGDQNTGNNDKADKGKEDSNKNKNGKPNDRGEDKANQQPNDSGSDKNAENKDKNDNKNSKSEDNRNGQKSDAEKPNNSNPFGANDRNQNAKGKPERDRLVASPEALAKMGLNQEKAKMLLDAMKTGELQYIQQAQRPSTKAAKKGRPDW